jgi:hypothetical protein
MILKILFGQGFRAATYHISKTDIQNSARPFTLWGCYEEKTLRTSEFLREVGNLFAPSISRTAVWREERKSWQLSIFQWNYRCEFNSVIVWWMIWCPINNMGYMKNKQNNEFSHFFYSWHILYDNKSRYWTHNGNFIEI